jgi:hypothetical protein
MNATQIITTEKNPGSLDRSKFIVESANRRVTINGLTYVKGADHAYPRGYIDLDAAQRVADSHTAEAISEGRPERPQVVRFGVAYAVVLNAIPAQADDAVTTGGNGDAYPGIIVARTAKRIQVARVGFRIDPSDAGMKEGRRVGIFYTYAHDQSDDLDTYTLRSNGRWMAKGTAMNAWYGSARIGTRAYAQNPSF